MGVEALKVFFGWVPLSQHVTPPRLALLLKYSVENAEGAHDPALADMAPSGAAQRKRGDSRRCSPDWVRRRPPPFHA